MNLWTTILERESGLLDARKNPKKFWLWRGPKIMNLWTTILERESGLWREIATNGYQRRLVIFLQRLGWHGRVGWVLLGFTWRPNGPARGPWKKEPLKSLIQKCILDHIPKRIATFSSRKWKVRTNYNLSRLQIHKFQHNQRRLSS